MGMFGKSRAPNIYAQPTAQAYKPTMRDNMARAALNLFGDTHGNQQLARNILGSSGLGYSPANPLGMSLADLTPLGLAFAADEAGRQAGQGHPFKAAGNLALAAVPVPAVAKGAKGMLGKGLRAVEKTLPDRVARGLLPDGSLDVGWITRDVRLGAANYGELNTAQIRAMNRLHEASDFQEAEVPISRLIATQNKVNPDFMAHAGKRAAEGGPESLPAVYRVNGNLVLTDGHHRIAGAAGAGRQTAKVRLYDIDSYLNGPSNTDVQPNLFQRTGQ